MKWSQRERHASRGAGRRRPARSGNVKEEGVGRKRRWDENESRRGAHWTRNFGRDAASAGKRRHINKSKKECPDGDGGSEPDDDEMDEVEGVK